MPTADKRDLLIKQLKAKVRQLEEQLKSGLTRELCDRVALNVMTHLNHMKDATEQEKLVVVSDVVFLSTISSVTRRGELT